MRHDDAMSTKTIQLIDIDEYVKTTQHIFITLIYNLQQSLDELVDNYIPLDDRQLRFHINSPIVQLRLREYVTFHLDYLIQESRFYNKINPHDSTPEQQFVDLILESLMELDLVELESEPYMTLKKKLPDLIVLELDELTQIYQEELSQCYDDRWQIIELMKRYTYMLIIKRGDFRLQWFEDHYKG